MIRDRVIFGSLLSFGAAGALVADRWLAPRFPCLFACLALVSVLAVRELVRLFPAAFRPSESFAVGSVLLIVAANWYGAIHSEIPNLLPSVASPWEPVLFALVAVVLAGFLAEMSRYREPGAAIPRLGLLVLGVAYVGLLGSFLAQLRWLRPDDPYLTGLFLSLTIFVPKAADSGAFFTGTYLGRHRMTPVLSPKKSWEGFAGGMVTAVVVAVGLSLAGDVFRGGILEAAAFGLVVGVAGVLGDLAESLVKRDCQAKDSAQSIPGLGGLLDVIDSILFAAPVAYFWFRA